MIDTHAHLYDSQFDEDRPQMLERAWQAGVKQIWLPNCNSETIKPMLQVHEQYGQKCLPMIGLHPCYVKDDVEQELKVVEQELATKKYVMIGEIGIDYYWDLSFVKQQEMAFIKQVEWAKEHQLPICIHSRNSKDNSLNAIQKCIELLSSSSPLIAPPQPSPKGGGLIISPLGDRGLGLLGIFHCFSGNLEEAKAITEMGFLLGIGGVASFKNGGLDSVLPHINLQHLVLETDAPYLAPVPHRGKRNESSYLHLVVQKIADYQHISVEKVIQKTTSNAMKLLKN